MNTCRKTLVVIILSISVALCMLPASAASENAQEMVIYSGDTILGRVTSISPDTDAGALSVTITSLARGINVQPAKVGDTLLENDIIMLVPGASASVKYADRPEATLRGGTDGTAYVIRRGIVAAVTGTPEVTGVVATGTVPEQRTFTIPRDSRGQLKVVTITSTGGNEDYILRSGNKITVKNGMEIKGGDKIFVVGKYSIGLSEDKYLPPGTVWTINEMAKTPEKTPTSVSSQGFAEALAEWLQPFYGIMNDIERGFSSFFTSQGSSKD